MPDLTNVLMAEWTQIPTATLPHLLERFLSRVKVTIKAKCGLECDFQNAHLDVVSQRADVLKEDYISANPLVLKKFCRTLSKQITQD